MNIIVLDIFKKNFDKPFLRIMILIVLELLKRN